MANIYSGEKAKQLVANSPKNLLDLKSFFIKSRALRL